MPKSPSLSTPSRRRRRFCGFTSRCTRPGVVRGGERRGRSGCRALPTSSARQRPAARDELGERLAVDVLHRDERAAVVLADVVDAHDVRVREPRGEACLAQEARAQLVVAREVLGEALQRDGTVELDVAREVDDRHRAVPERALELVAARRPSVAAPSSVPVLVLSFVARCPSPCLRRRGTAACSDLRREVVDAARERLEQPPWNAVRVHGGRSPAAAARRRASARRSRRSRRVTRRSRRPAAPTRCASARGSFGCARRGGRAACEPQPASTTASSDEDARPSHWPAPSRAASASGSPASRISACVRSTSYGDAPERRRARVEVEHEVGGMRVAVARLADRARVQQPARLAEAEHRCRRATRPPSSSVPRSATCSAAWLWPTRTICSSVREQRRERGFVGEHVLPHGSRALPWKSATSSRAAARLERLAATRATLAEHAARPRGRDRRRRR